MVLCQSAAYGVEASLCLPITMSTLQNVATRNGESSSRVDGVLVVPLVVRIKDTRAARLKLNILYLYDFDQCPLILWPVDEVKIK